MLGIGANLIKSAYRRGLAYVRDGLKLYMPYRGANHSEVKFVGAGSTTFDGTNDYVSVADDSTLTSASGFSVACWVKLTTISGDIAIITKNSDLTTFNSSSEFLVSNTILVHRKKQTNTLYTFNALNELIKSLNNGYLDKSYRVNWNDYKNCILLIQTDGFNRIDTRVKTIINLS